MPSDERKRRLAAGVDVVELRCLFATVDVVALQIVVRPTGIVGLLRINVVEAVTGDLRRRAEVPFADLTGGITDFFESFGDGEFSVKADQSIAVRFNAKPILRLAYEQSRSRGHTLRSSRIAAQHAHAGLCQSIDMRCF